METWVTILFDGSRFPGGPEAALLASGCGLEEARIETYSTLTRQSVTVNLRQDDERLTRLLGVLYSSRVQWKRLVRDVFSDEELLAAPLLFIRPSCGIEISGGAKHGTRYGVAGACARCGSGAKQLTPLFVGGEELDGLRDAKHAQTFHDDIIIREDVAEDLEDAVPSGIDLRQVFESTGHTQRRLPFLQMLATEPMPPMSPQTTGLVRDEVCSSCGRNGHFQTPDEPTRIVYHEAALAGAKDVNESWEWFGYVARPRLLVSPKVVRVFMRHALDGFECLPVRIEDGRSW